MSRRRDAKRTKAKAGVKSARARVRRPATPSGLRAKETRLAEVLEQQAATSEILRVIRSSPTDVQPVFDMIADRAMRLCGGLHGGVLTFDGQLIHMGAHVEASSDFSEALRRAFPMPPGRGTAGARAVLTRAAVLIPDLDADPEFVLTDTTRAAGFRSTLAVPMLRDGHAIGAIVVLGGKPRSLTQRHVALLETFADQAVIAIENVRLFGELAAKNRDLTETLEQQTATGEILRVISSSPSDVQPVFDAIAAAATTLCAGENTGLFLFDGTLIHLAAFDHYTPEDLQAISQQFPRPPGPGSLSARAILTRAVVHSADISADPDYQLGSLVDAGFRATLAVPMLRDGEPIGTITVTRREAVPFTATQIALLETFAQQAVIAIGNVRLFRELETRNRDLTDSLEQQTATSEILRVISSSPTEVQPVFDTIAESAVRLCGAEVSTVTRFDGEWIHIGAVYGSSTAGVEALRRTFPMRPGGAGGAARAIRDRAVVNIPDVLDDPEYQIQDTALVSGFRAVLGVPMLRDGHGIGAIALGRAEPGEFSNAQIQLLQTFADQAVIAIENVRLFKALESRNRDLTATSEILRVISGSPTDVQPVFDAIAASARQLCDGFNGAVLAYDGTFVHLVALDHVSPEGSESLRRAFPQPPSRASSATRAILYRDVVQIPDVLEDPEYIIGPAAQAAGFRSVVSVPMLREGAPIGAIVVTRQAPGVFADSQIDLLKTFADQAVIAIENVRLFKELDAKNRDLTEMLEQQTATGEILRVISSSPTDVRPVLEAVADNAARLCEAEDVSIIEQDGEVFRVVAVRGSDQLREFDGAPVSRGSVTGRAIVDGTLVHIHDMTQESETEYPVSKVFSQRIGHRTMLATPLLREGTPIGAIFLRRVEVRPFSDKQIALLQTFADQAVIAIENVRLFKALESRNRELTETLEQQTATSEILRVISSSPTDVQPVFDAVAESAARLCESFDAAIYRRDGDRLPLVAHYGEIPVGAIGEFSLGVPGTVAGRAVEEGRPVHVADTQIEGAEFPQSSEHARRFGFRTMLCVPLMREGVAVGVMSLRRAEVRLFTDRQVALLQTFADQAVIAIENVRLFKELEARNAGLTEALEQQTATGEILRVISRSPTDVQPVFDTIAEHAWRLCDATVSGVCRYDGELVHVVALGNVSMDSAIARAFPMPPSNRSGAARAVLTGQVVHVPDVTEDPEYGVAPQAQAGGFRGVLAVPMLRDGRAIGSIIVGRDRPGAYSERQIELLKTFADQAVIAIENVRLFKELEAKNSDLTETLEQQTATSDILRVISSSPTDVQPVFDAVAESAARLCESLDAAIFRRDGDQLVLVANHGSIPQGGAVGEFSLPLVRGTAPGRAMLDGRAVHVADMQAEIEEFPESGRNAQRQGFRTNLCVPLMREGEAIGAIALRRAEVRLFTDRQVALLETFADQAVIAIENVRLFKELEAKNRDLTETLEQQTATGEILRVISSSPTDVQPVFDTIAHSAARLCDAQFCFVFRFDGQLLHFSAQHGLTPDGVAAMNSIWPMPPTRGTCAGRSVLDRQMSHIADVHAEPGYQHAATAEIATFRSIVAVPMIRDGIPIGTITLGRDQVGLFPDRQVDLLKTFADQAVIAIENVRLFKELEAKNRDLTETLEQQTATGEILRVISRSPTDVRPVFDTIVRNARGLCDADSASVFIRDGEMVRLESQDNHDPAKATATADAYPLPANRGHATGRAILTGRFVHIPDLREDSEYALTTLRDTLELRSLLSVPMIRDGVPVGAITVQRWGMPRPFSDKQIALLQTFADQAVIAIENVRLFKELEAKNRDLSESLEQQTTTSEILRVISQSPTDVQPVFDTIVQNAVELCGARIGAVFGYDEGLLRLVAHYNFTPESLEAIQRLYPMRPDRSQASGRVILDGTVVEIPELLADPEYRQEVAVASGWRSMLGVPLLREGQPIGVIIINRTEAGPFQRSHVELLRTFADQAVIAIENVRLFKELDARNGELRVALDQQTATSELLKVIGRSTFDLQPVFETLAESAVRMCEAERGLIYRFDGQLLRFAAGHNISPDMQAFVEQNPVPPGRTTTTARAAIDRRTTHIHDVRADAEYTYGARNVDPVRTVLSIPMMRAGELLGVITIYRFEVWPFSDSQIALMETFADQAAIAIENARLLNALQERTAQLTRSVEELKALGEVSQAVGSTLDVETVLATIVSRAAQLSGSEQGIVYEFDEDTQSFQVRAAHHMAPDLIETLRAARIRLGEGAIGSAGASRKPVEVGDVENEAHLLAPGTRAILLREGIRSLLVVPLVREDRVLGAIAIGRREQGAFSPEVVAILHTFATQSVLAIHNARLFREIQRQKQYADALVQTSPVAIATVDLHGGVVGWNPGAERLFGHTQAEALGRPLDELVATTAEIREEVRSAVHQAIETGERPRAIIRRARKDGSLVDVETAAVPIVVDGARVGLIAIYHDITDLLQARREAEAANEAKSAFLATMSHEIRTPMNAVIGMSGLLLNTLLTDEQREYAEVVRQSGDALLTVINDILDFSKIEAGKLELESQPFDVRECVESALDLVSTRAAEKGLDLAYLMGEGVPAAVVGDVTRLRQILLNLLSNAVKFTERGEVVLSVTARHPEGAATHELTFAVRDTGIGIPADRVDRLFQSFSQVDASTTRRYGGTGLGLAISQRLTELMGGRITVTSEMGAGSEFRFTIRAAAAAAVAVPTRRDLSGVQPSLRGKRVLVVDDNATNRRILTAHLDAWGMQARASASPLEALGWVRAGERFDVGILDMHMPEMDGITLAHAIRDCPAGATLPLILFTSLGRREARAESEGFAAYLNKPIKPSQLFDALVSVLPDQPVHVPERGVARSEFDPEMAQRHPLRILLAEDNVVNQKLALRLLAQMGYRADLAANGLEAVDAVERQTYDVVLMDVQMPEMDGLEASREINRRWPGDRRPRLVAMTANAMQGDRELCVAAGMDDYVAKPIRVEELVAALARSGQRRDPAAREASAAMIDRNTVEQLASTMGGAFVGELIDTFIEDGRQLVATLRQALERNDLDAFRRAAHSLKSNGETLGAGRLAILARELEAMARGGSLTGADEQLDPLTREYESAAEALGQLRRELAP